MRTEIFLGPGTADLRKMEETTGKYVRPKIIAPIKAKLNTSAMGRNIFPSTPESERMGMKTMMMINWPKIAECIILEEPLKAILSFSACLSWRDSPSTSVVDLVNW